jgi:hypothetical protein
VKGCIPEAVSPMIASRLKPRKPFPVSMILLSSGPLESVADSASATASMEAVLPQYPKIEHITVPPQFSVFLCSYMDRKNKKGASVR